MSARQAIQDMIASWKQKLITCYREPENPPSCKVSLELNFNRVIFMLAAIASSSLLSCGGSFSLASPERVGDFTISVTPSSVSTQVGGTTAPVNVTITAQDGFTGPVLVTAIGFPNGINASPGSAFTLSAGSSQHLTFLAPEAAGTFQIQFQGSSGVLLHSASTTLTVTPLPNPYLVSASYYPWYQPVAWTYAECSNGTLRGNLAPAQLPALGQYNSQDENVATQQIAWSSAAGINVWDLEWVSPGDLLDTTIQSTILTNPHIGDIHFAIFYDYAIRFNSDFNVTLNKIATIVADFQYIASHYFSHPSYLRSDRTGRWCSSMPQ